MLEESFGSDTDLQLLGVSGPFAPTNSLRSHYHLFQYSGSGWADVLVEPSAIACSARLLNHSPGMPKVNWVWFGTISFYLI